MQQCAKHLHRSRSLSTKQIMPAEIVLNGHQLTKIYELSNNNHPFEGVVAFSKLVTRIPRIASQWIGDLE